MELLLFAETMHIVDSHGSFQSLDNSIYVLHKVISMAVLGCDNLSGMGILRVIIIIVIITHYCAMRTVRDTSNF